MRAEHHGLFLGLLAVVAFGLTLPATRHITPYFDPVFIGLGRASLAALFAALILLVTRSQLPNLNQFFQLVIVSLGVVIGFPVLSAWSMQTLPASHGGVVMGVLPLITAAVGAMISNERPSIMFWLLGLIGSALVVSYALIDGAGALQLADIALFVAILCAAIAYAVGGVLARQLGGWQVICWALLIALPFMLYPAWLRSPDSWQTIPSSALWSFLYLALVSQLLGFFAWYKALAIGGVARVSQLQLLQPFVTLAASALLLGEAITSTTVVFGVLVVASVAIGKKMPIYHKQ